MIQMMKPNGAIIEVSGEKFRRTLSMGGTHSSSPEQRKKAQVGNHVKVGGVFGPIVFAITAVSTDGLTWRDENGAEHHTCDILL